MNRSIARRLAMMFALVALSVFTLVGTGLFLVMRVQLNHHLRESLDDRMEIARSSCITRSRRTNGAWRARS